MELAADRNPLLAADHVWPLLLMHITHR